MAEIINKVCNILTPTLTPMEGGGEFAWDRSCFEWFIEMPHLLNFTKCLEGAKNMEDLKERLVPSVSTGELERRWKAAREMMRDQKIDFLLSVMEDQEHYHYASCGRDE